MATRSVTLAGAVVSGPLVAIRTQLILVLEPPMASIVSLPSETTTVLVAVRYSSAVVLVKAGRTTWPSARRTCVLS